MSDFNFLGVSDTLQQILEGYGICTPTPVQEQSICHILDGMDLVVQAQTGTGKTLAFVLPILDKLDPKNPHIQALILAPTRELALQISTEVDKLVSKLEEIQVLAVYGGQDVESQIKKLGSTIHLIIATPGRLLDHLRRGTIQLADVNMFVLDEADQMLHMGFITEVEEIIAQLPEKRQTLLFSATMPKPIRKIAGQYMKDPLEIQIHSKQITVDKIKQLVIETTDRTKQKNLRTLLDQYRPRLAMIFCRTKRRAHTLNQALQEFGYSSDELHGDLSQAKREEVMKRFREKQLQFLVATDVAARGLDVEGVTHVFNYDIPIDVESYIHRIGRTGRAGEKGLAITLVAPKDKSYLSMIENGIKMSLPRKKV
nr:DEAD/DEAH box helicase [Caldalkalibacillus mannanilyticus]